MIHHELGDDVFDVHNGVAYVCGGTVSIIEYHCIVYSTGRILFDSFWHRASFFNYICYSYSVTFTVSSLFDLLLEYISLMMVGNRMGRIFLVHPKNVSNTHSKTNHTCRNYHSETRFLRFQLLLGYEA